MEETYAAIVMAAGFGLRGQIKIKLINILS